MSALAGYPVLSPRLQQVELQGVTRNFGTTPALRGVTASFRNDAIVLLSGPNGAGKSTLLSLVGTQLKPSRGTLAYTDAHGRALDRTAVRARLGWVSHEIQCYAQLTGRENVKLAADLQGADMSRYEELCEGLGLGRFSERPMTTLSRGQRQRVALARALIHRPDLLLLDEPWTGLDTRSSELLERVVLGEAAAGSIVVVVSHQEGLESRLGARRLHLVRGRLQEPPAAPGRRAPSTD